MVLRAHTAVGYVVDQDGINPFTGPILTLSLPTRAYGWQFVWDDDIAGTFVFEGSIYPAPYKWESLIVCEKVEIITSEHADTKSSIVSIPNAWHVVGFIRWKFVPGPSSSGLFSAALRTVPV